MACLRYLLLLTTACGVLHAQPGPPRVAGFSESLPYFLKHFPVSGEHKLLPEGKPHWKPMPEGLDIHVTWLGLMHGRSLHAVRYLPTGKPGSTAAGSPALLILAAKRESAGQLEPVYFSGQADNKFYFDHTASSVMKIQGQPFIVLRTILRDVNGSVTFRTCLTLNPKDNRFQLSSLSVTPEELLAQFKDGWDLEKEGGYDHLDEQNLSMAFPFVRRARGSNKAVQASFVYEWRFKAGKLQRQGPRRVIQP